jgi:mRNA interferase MazF
MTSFSQLACTQGQVVLLRFPFTDQSSGKQRPAIVISANWFNLTHEDCILAAITHVIPPKLDKADLKLTAEEVTDSGLLRPGIVKLGKIVTLEKSQIIKAIGTLPAPTLQKVLHGVKSTLEELE